MADTIQFNMQLDLEIDAALEEIKLSEGIPKAAYARLAILERLERMHPETLKKRTKRQ